MRNTLTILSVALIALAALAVRGDDQPSKPAGGQEKAPSLWMKQKLVASQTILAALTRADYDAIEKNANAMLDVGFLEKWIRAGTPNYRTLMNDFQYANKSLVQAAKEKNLDAATVAYLQLIFSCVNCHRLVRDAGR